MHMHDVCGVCFVLQGSICNTTGTTEAKCMQRTFCVWSSSYGCHFALYSGDDAFSTEHNNLEVRSLCEHHCAHVALPLVNHSLTQPLESLEVRSFDLFQRILPDAAVGRKAVSS